VLEAMRGRREGDQVALSILRDRKPQSISITLPKMPPMPPMPPSPPRVAMPFDSADGGLLMEGLRVTDSAFNIVTFSDAEMPESFEIEIPDMEIGEPR